MNRRNAKILVATMSGKYNLSPIAVTTSGTDQFGNPVTESIDEHDVDMAQIERDVDAGLWELPTISGIARYRKAK